ncbi:MAG: class I SAM-dependent methyltransferase [Candidatus Helarchaeota archaeon]
MYDSTQKWIFELGPKFISSIGIKKGNFVVDFGCNEGHYTFPIAQIVGSEGKVYAIDNSESTLNDLKKESIKLGLDKYKNIITINNSGSLRIPSVKEKSIDCVLTFDILHYLDKKERTSLYKEIYKILKPGGNYFVYPKHHKNDWPMWNLADLSVNDVINEIESYGFKLVWKKEFELFHYYGLNHGIVLNFSR